jgi:hypothetical protein
MKTKNIVKLSSIAVVVASATLFAAKDVFLEASSHREAPIISNDPLADNTDLYAFRSPDDPTTVTIIANYVPFELPQGGPNYYSFGENVRYEIHVKNEDTSAVDNITYRFTFSKTNEDPTTFFNIRLGKQNLKTTYKLEKLVKGQAPVTIVANGIVPPPNIGPRSIDASGIGLGTSYQSLMASAIATATTGEKVFCGPVDDPFFVDLGGIFDLGQTRSGAGARDGLKNLNVHTIALKIPINLLQKNGKPVSAAKDILDSDFIIGVWASASRPKISTFKNGMPLDSGAYVQVSRLGMPLTNEAVIPLGSKDKWNGLTPYTEDPTMEDYFTNPELALYMDSSQFGGAVPAFADLRIQSKSLGGLDFRNGKGGLFALKNTAALNGTALAKAAFGDFLLRDKAPRSVDLLPIFYTGVPNLIPYQLATGKKKGNPLTAGKPFINNFLPTIGDMLRLNMAVPPTPRNDPKFSSLGLVQAAVLGLTDPAYNTTTALQFIPNMDGFPNGRRLEDDVTRIELQAVSGIVLAAIGLWYDDYDTSKSPVTPKLLKVYGYTTGVEHNDTTFQTMFPYEQTPWRGYSKSGGGQTVITGLDLGDGGLGLAGNTASAFNYPNPFIGSTTIHYKTVNSGQVVIKIYDSNGLLVANLVDEDKTAGTYEDTWTPAGMKSGTYLASIYSNKSLVKTVKMQVTQK